MLHARYALAKALICGKYFVKVWSKLIIELLGISRKRTIHAKLLF